MENNSNRDEFSNTFLGKWINKIGIVAIFTSVTGIGIYIGISNYRFDHFEETNNENSAEIKELRIITRDLEKQIFELRIKYDNYRQMIEDKINQNNETK